MCNVASRNQPNHSTRILQSAFSIVVITRNMKGASWTNLFTSRNHIYQIYLWECFFNPRNPMFYRFRLWQNIANGRNNISVFSESSFAEMSWILVFELWTRTDNQRWLRQTQPSGGSRISQKLKPSYLLTILLQTQIYMKMIEIWPRGGGGGVLRGP